MLPAAGRYRRLLRPPPPPPAHSVSLGRSDEDWQHLSCTCGQSWKIVVQVSYSGTFLTCPASHND
jgi:hypothetical protein